MPCNPRKNASANPMFFFFEDFKLLENQSSNQIPNVKEPRKKTQAYVQRTIHNLGRIELFELGEVSAKTPFPFCGRGKSQCREHKVRKDDAFQRGRQIAFWMYGHFRGPGTHDAAVDQS